MPFTSWNWHSQPSVQRDTRRCRVRHACLPLRFRLLPHRPLPDHLSPVLAVHEMVTNQMMILTVLGTSKQRATRAITPKRSPWHKRGELPCSPSLPPEEYRPPRRQQKRRAALITGTFLDSGDHGCLSGLAFAMVDLSRHQICPRVALVGIPSHTGITVAVTRERMSPLLAAEAIAQRVSIAACRLCFASKIVHVECFSLWRQSSSPKIAWRTPVWSMLSRSGSDAWSRNAWVFFVGVSVTLTAHGRVVRPLA